MAQTPWNSCPPAPGLPLDEARASGHLLLPNGTKLWHAFFGVDLKTTINKGKVPLVLLTGGLSHSGYYGDQVRYLAPQYTILTFDHRGHGRTPLGKDKDLTYDKLTSDLVQLLDHYSIPKVALMGWSDGAMVAWNMLRHHIDRVDRVFAYGGVDDCEKNDGDSIDKLDSVVSFFAQSQAEWAAMNPGQDADENFAPYYRLWKSEPKWTAETFRHVPTRWETPGAPIIWVVAGDHDEWLPREVTDRIRKFVHNSSYLELPACGHLAFVQAPTIFSYALACFLEDDKTA